MRSLKEGMMKEESKKILKRTKMILLFWIIALPSCYAILAAIFRSSPGFLLDKLWYMIFVPCLIYSPLERILKIEDGKNIKSMTISEIIVWGIFILVGILGLTFQILYSLNEH